MVTSHEVRQQVEEYFGDKWLFYILATGGWATMTEVEHYFNIHIEGKEIRIYPIKTNREAAIRLAIWDFKFQRNPGTNKDDMYITNHDDLLNIAILLDKFFP
jgi:hypothetical protein